MWFKNLTWFENLRSKGEVKSILEVGVKSADIMQVCYNSRRGDSQGVSKVGF